MYLTDAIGEKLDEAITISEPDEDFTGCYNQFLNQKVANNYSLSQEKLAADSTGDPEAMIDFKKIKLRYEVNVVFALK